MNTTNISIRCGAVGGDCTSLYYVTLKKPMTVGEFIDEWVKEMPGEWGSIRVCDGVHAYGNPCCVYKHGKIVDNYGMTQEILSKPIKEVNGSGGWSLSDFGLLV